MPFLIKYGSYQCVQKGIKPYSANAITTMYTRKTNVTEQDIDDDDCDKTQPTHFEDDLLKL